MNSSSDAYTEESFQRHCKLLRNELSKLGVNISEDDSRRISFLSRRKYDRYDHFFPGESFDDRLLKWLMNFEKKERQIALEIIKSLKFISTYEMKYLAIQTYENIKNDIINEIENQNENWIDFLNLRVNQLDGELFRSIFVASVDDAEFSFFRRYAMRSNRFKKDNFVEYYKRDEKSLDELPQHKRIYIIDQLSGSGTTAIRKKGKKWAGKIPTFHRIWKNHIKSSKIYYCPYILSTIAEKNLQDRIADYEKECDLKVHLLPTCRINISSCLANSKFTDIDEAKPVSKLCIKYYNRFNEDKHIRKAGSACFGYGRAGLTLILQPNCPNNSIYLLWHSGEGWFPLFPRVDHHKEV